MRRVGGLAVVSSCVILSLLSWKEELQFDRRLVSWAGSSRPFFFFHSKLPPPVFGPAMSSVTRTYVPIQPAAATATSVPSFCSVAVASGMISGSLGMTFPQAVDQLVSRCSVSSKPLLMVLDISKELHVPESMLRSTVHYARATRQIRVVHVSTIPQLLALLSKYQLSLPDDPTPSSIVVWGLLSSHVGSQQLNLALSRLQKLNIPITVAEDEDRPEYIQWLKPWAPDLTS